MSNRISHEEFLKRSKIALDFVEIISDNKYETKKTIFRCKCKKCKHEYEVKADSLMDGHGCRKCAKTYVPTNEEFIDNIKEINPNIKILGKYQKAKIPIRCQCLKCGYNEWYPTPDMLRQGIGCPACYGRVAIPYKTDVYTLRKDLTKYLENEKDAIGILPYSNKRVNWKCLNCNMIVEDSFRNVNRVGFRCKFCGDGLSYPEKILRAILSQIEVRYDVQKTFKWSGNKRYDFYIPSLNCIIETHGRQHYEETFGFKDYYEKEKTLEQEQDNDKIKKKIALDNGIKFYIEIDCRESKINYIRESIIKGELLNILKIKEQDIIWEECESFYNKSLQLKTMELYNEGFSMTNIADKLKLSRTTIKLYMRNLASLGCCDYDPIANAEKSKFMSNNVPHSTKFLRCVETNRVFNGLLECASYLKENSDLKVVDHRKIKVACEDGSAQYGLHFEYVKIEPLYIESK